MERKQSKKSTFFITINSQRSDDEFKERLRDCYNTFYEHVDQFLKLKDVNDVNLIDRVDSKAVIEVGGVKNLVHVHALLFIYHHTKVLLDYAKMRLYFSQYLNVANIYMKVKFVPDNISNLEQYFGKDPQ